MMDDFGSDFHATNWSDFKYDETSWWAHLIQRWGSLGTYGFCDGYYLHDFHIARSCDV